MTSATALVIRQVTIPVVALLVRALVTTRAARRWQGPTEHLWHQGLLEGAGSEGEEEGRRPRDWRGSWAGQTAQEEEEGEEGGREEGEEEEGKGVDRGPSTVYKRSCPGVCTDAGMLVL
jgi:hypothetical protein